MKQQPREYLLAWWQRANRRARWTAAAGAVGVVATGTLLLTTGGEGSLPGSNTWYYLGVLVKLVGVLLLIVGGAVMLRKYQFTRAAVGPTRQLKLMESVRLTPRQALHLVKAGDQYLLVGATDQGISFLSHVSSQAAEGKSEEKTLPVIDFQTLLSSVAPVSDAGSDHGNYRA